MKKETYKAQVRIPLKEYSYIELTAEGTPEELKSVYDEMSTVCRLGYGLPDKEWRDVLDTYLTSNKMDAEAYANMSEQQRDIIQEIKRSFKRINYRDNK